MIMLALAPSRDLTAPRFEAAVKAGAKFRSKLTACTPNQRALWFKALDATRIDGQFTLQALAREAGVSERWLLALRSEPHRASPRALTLIFNALKRLRGEPRAAMAPAPVVYGGFLAAACTVVRADIALARAIDPARHLRGAAAGDDVRRAALARRIAIYLAVTETGCRQSDVARAAGLTPAAVCLALQAMEDERDDEQVDAMVAAIGRLVTGGE